MTNKNTVRCVLKSSYIPPRLGRSEGEKGGGDMQGKVEEMDGEEKKGKERLD